MKRTLITAAALLLVSAIAHADDCAPSKVSNLTVAATGYHAAQLTFTDPGDDCLTGTATSYEIRISSSPITEDNYYSATLLVSGDRRQEAVGPRTARWRSIRRNSPAARPTISQSRSKMRLETARP